MSAAETPASFAFKEPTVSCNPKIKPTTRPFAPFVIAAESKDSIGDCFHIDQSAVSACASTPDKDQYYNYQRVCYCQSKLRGVQSQMLRGKKKL